jgi:hypothetical protein
MSVPTAVVSVIRRQEGIALPACGDGSSQFIVRKTRASLDSKMEAPKIRGAFGAHGSEGPARRRSPDHREEQRRPERARHFGYRERGCQLPTGLRTHYASDRQLTGIRGKIMVWRNRSAIPQSAVQDRGPGVVPPVTLRGRHRAERRAAMSHVRPSPGRSARRRPNADPPPRRLPLLQGVIKAGDENAPEDHRRQHTEPHTIGNLPHANLGRDRRSGPLCPQR